MIYMFDVWKVWILCGLFFRVFEEIVESVTRRGREGQGRAVRGAAEMRARGIQRLRGATAGEVCVSRRSCRRRESVEIVESLGWRGV